MGEILVHGNGARLFSRDLRRVRGVVSNREKLPIRRQLFLSATIAEGKLGLNQSDHLAEASNRMHAYEVRPRKDHRGVNLISDAQPRREVVRDPLVAVFAGWCFCK
jgi:hypothetical protein